MTGRCLVPYFGMSSKVLHHNVLCTRHSASCRAARMNVKTTARAGATGPTVGGRHSIAALAEA